MPPQDLVGTLQRAGFRGPALNTAYAVMMAESGGNPRAHNPNRATGDNSYGLFQINMLNALGPERRRQFNLPSNEALFDPIKNAQVAFRMSGGGKNWQPWSAYKSGAYKKYLGQGMKGTAGADLLNRKGNPRQLAETMTLTQAAQQPLPNDAVKRTGLINFLMASNQALIEKKPQPSMFNFLNSLKNEQTEAQAQAYGGTTVTPVSRKTGNVPQGPPNMQKVLNIAHQQIGKPYVWGGESPQEGGFDCSGLIDYAFEQAGIPTPGRLTSQSMLNIGRSVKQERWQPGDWIVTNGGKHVVMYVGNNKVIAAPRRGEVVQYQPVSRFKGDIVDVRRFPTGKK